MNYILVADKQEEDNIKIQNALKDKVKIITFGVWGSTAAIKKLSQMMLNHELNKNDRFFNTGYVGSNEFPIGSTVIVGTVSKEIPSHTVKVRFSFRFLISAQVRKYRIYKTLIFTNLRTTNISKCLPCSNSPRRFFNYNI